MTPRDHVVRAQVFAEAATNPRDVAAYKAVAAAWERMSRPATPWSAAPAERQLAQLQREACQPLKQRPAPAEDSSHCQIGATHHVPAATITF